MSYKLFLDDVRDPEKTKHVVLPLGPWVVTRNYKEFVQTIHKQGVPEFVAFDHDLAGEHYEPETDPKTYSEKTGADAAQFLVRYCQAAGVDFPAFVIHSMNPVGRDRIRAIISEIVRD